jgi:hypothetical protein
VVRADTCGLPAAVPDSMVLWDGPVMELPREPRSDDRTYVSILTDVQDSGAGSILRAGPQPAGVCSFDMGEEALPEWEPSAGTHAGRAAAKQSTLSIDSRLFRKRPLADFTDWVSGHRTLAERARSTAGRPAGTRCTLLAATPCHTHSRWIRPPRPTGRT